MLSLSEFLAQYPPDTDLRVTQWTSEAESHVRCVLRTSPWWCAPEERDTDNGELMIECTRVAESEIRLGWRASEVEDLEVTEEDPLLWAFGQHGRIYGNAPLPDPDGFFLAFVDLVEHELQSVRRALSYLGGISYSQWRERVTKHTAYALIEGPAALLLECTPLLDAQVAEYRILLGPEHPTPGLMLVIIGESTIICGDARVAVSPPLRA